MHQSVLMNTDIHKSTEIGDVGDRAFQNHARTQIIHGFNAIGKGGGFKLRTRVTTGFLQFFEDVGNGRHTELFSDKILCFQIAQHITVTHQITEGFLCGLQDFFHHRIGFRVNGGGIQRIFTAGNTQEPGALLKGFRAETRDFQQLFAVSKTAVFITPVNNILCDHFAQPGNAGQQGDRCGVEVNADGVYAVFHYRIQFTGKLCLADIMLILADPDGFRVDFHQFGQRIL
ncbi:Uncharacterised protein [Mycobacterium tuberculosis]|nr:Uncharacterised protein [Mycobacterium tuberculosis]